MISALLSRLIILAFGNLYPAYASYKAVRTKNVKEYVKWMMYWIVFAFFTCIETCTDIFLSWFPFYYEIKILIVLWLLSPATRGSSTLYRKFVHPMLTKREHEIDEYINQARERGYSAVLQLGSKSVNYATNVIMQTALKTFQYGVNGASTNQPGRLLTSSQSETSVYAQQSRLNDQDVTDYAVNRLNRMPKSYSLDVISSMHNEFSEDEQLENVPIQYDQIDENEELMEMARNGASGDFGAARSRELPVRKVRGRKAAVKKSEKTNGVKSRRKLREPSVSELDVDVE